MPIEVFESVSTLQIILGEVHSPLKNLSLLAPCFLLAQRLLSIRFQVGALEICPGAPPSPDMFLLLVFSNFCHPKPTRVLLIVLDTKDVSVQFRIVLTATFH
jgi:hypothetical protein